MSGEVKTLHLDNVIDNHTKSMDGAVVAITGTTSGTGYVAARELAKKGAEVILLNRESERAIKSLEKLSSDVPTGKFVQIICDLQSMESVEKSITQIKSKYKVVDVLCNNAGVMALEDYATIDGYDVQMQTNVISHFQLFRGLLPLLKESKEARIINHTSMARMGGPLKAEYFGKNGGELGGDELIAGENSRFSGGRWERYHQTKLANFVFTYALKQKMAEENILNITSMVAHPGLAKTNLQITTAKAGGMDADSEFMSNSQSAEDGATGIIRAAMDIEAKSGDFFGPKEWVGFPERLEPELELISQHNIDVFWKGCEAAVGRVKL
ncbi:MAG: NAD(P)-dependent dehydrogenase (short-subunit alcohol dehydrogenase family) [Thermoproteota archaeon]|jgi:NAD(P)-dependent dehydrogenase (short-subunit alcohol dehydrogenase family)